MYYTQYFLFRPFFFHRRTGFLPHSVSVPLFSRPDALHPLFLAVFHLRFFSRASIILFVLPARAVL